MNSKQPRSKVGLLDSEINYLSKVLFLLMLLIAFLIIVLDGFDGSWYFKYFRFVLLLASIIPISLRVNLDLAKIYYSYCINHDEMIAGTIARNSTIPEELGRIQFLLSDKTGTLTQNDMIFKKVAMEFAHFSVETVGDLKKQLKESCEESSGPVGDLDLSGDSSIFKTNTAINGSPPTTGESALRSHQRRPHGGAKKNIKKHNREQHFIVRDLILALSLCHNVTPVYPDKNNPTEKELQASSPDEVALVRFADSLGMELLEREETYVKIENAAKNTEEYDILANFPFSSVTKRMGIILKHRDTGKIMFYLKGAETEMIKKVRPS